VLCTVPEFEFIHLYNFSVRQKTSFSCLVPGRRQLELEELVQTAAEGATVAYMNIAAQFKPASSI